MSKKRGTQHLKKKIPSERPSARRSSVRPKVAPRITERQGLNFYDIALTVEQDSAGVLRRKASPVKEMTAELRTLGYRMGYITQNDSNCAGIAAPQMRHSVRMVSVRDQDRKAHVIVNPEIVRTVSAVEVVEYEGCFSLPNQRVPIKRWSAVVLTGTSLEGKPMRMTLTGHCARAAQHEIDHLNGVLISDHGELEPVSGVIAAEA